MANSFTILGDPKTSPWTSGIAPSPLQGLANVRNLDIQTNPGSIKLNNLTQASVSTITGLITWFATDGGNFYAIDDANKVYKSIDAGITWTVIGSGTGSGSNGLGQGQGLAVWKNYLFAIGGGGVDVYGPLDSLFPVWVAFSAFTISSAPNQRFNPAFVSVDGCLYIANQNHVNKLEEATAPFAPGTSGSYIATLNAITIGTQYNITCMADLGQYLMLGTSGLPNHADIFPYDRSTLTLGIPIQVPENGVKMMLSVKSRLYFFAGDFGRLYISDTASYEQIAKIPDYLFSQEGNTLILYPGAIIFLNGKIFFGLGSNGGSANGNLGVWSYNPTTKSLQIENTISTGNDGSFQGVFIGALFPVARKQIIIGWRDIAVGYGIDYQSNTYLKYTNYTGYAESPLVKLGEILGNRTIGNLEVALTKHLAAQQGIRIKWRDDLSSAFTTLVTFDYTNYGGKQGYNFPGATLTNLVFLQIRIELTSGDTSSPEVQSVILHPSL